MIVKHFPKNIFSALLVSPHFIPVGLILTAAILNMLPDGYVVAGGDLTQWYNGVRQIPNYALAWSNESLGYAQLAHSHILLYILFELLGNALNFSASEASVFYYLCFLLSSYFSFYYSGTIYAKYFPSIEHRWIVILSVAYSFNIFTFYNFIGLWGFSPFFFLYTVIPIIFALTYAYFNSNEKGPYYLALLAIPVFLANIAFANLGFFVSFVGLITFYILLLVWNSNEPFNAKKVLIFYIVLGSCTAWSILHQLPELLRYAEATLRTTEAVQKIDWILGQAAKITDSFLVVNDHQFFSQYPLLILSSALTFIAMLLGVVLRYRNQEARKLILIFFSCYILAIFLLNKGNGWLNPILIDKLFNNFFLGALRSFHKSIIYLPYFVFVIILLGLSTVRIGFSRAIKSFVIVFTLIPTLYFLSGGFLKVISYNFPEGASYLNAPVSPIIKIPDEYVSASKLINQDKSIFRIMTLPYYVYDEAFEWRKINSMRYQGTNDPLWQLFDAPIVEMNDAHIFGGWNFGKDWGDAMVQESSWLISVAGMMNVKYFLLHKDVDRRFWATGLDKMQRMEKLGLIKTIAENNLINIYQISDEFVYPRLVLSNSVIPTENFAADTQSNSLVAWGNFPAVVNPRYEWRLLGKIANRGLSQNTPKFDFVRVNSSKYRLRIYRITEPVVLSLLDSFRGGWKIYAGQTSVNRKVQNIDIPLYRSIDDPIANALSQYDHGILETWFMKDLDGHAQHFVVNSYANGWLLDFQEICMLGDLCVRNGDGSYDIDLVIEYWPQQLILIGFFISIFVLLASLGYLLYFRITRVMGERPPN